MSAATPWRRMRAGLGPALLYGVVALLSFPTLGLLLFGEHGLALTHDVFDDAAGLPRLAMALELWRDGPAFWNPYLTAGNAFLSQSSVSPIALDVALAAVLRPFGAFVAVSWGYAFVAGYAMHCFIRDSLRLSTPAVVIGGIAFALSFLHFVFAAALAFVPLLLWLADRAATPDRRRWLAILAWIGLAAFMLYQSLTQVVLFGAALQLVWTIGTAEPGQRRGRLATWLGAWALALGLFGPVLVSQLAALPASHRAAWLPIERTVLEAFQVAADHYASVLIDVPNGLRLGISDPRYGALFMGAAGLALVILGIVIGRPDRRRRLLIGLLVIIPMLDVLAMVAVSWQTALGPFSTIQFVRVRHEWTVVLIGLLAYGADAVVRWSDAWVTASRRRRIAATIGVVAVVLLAVAEFMLVEPAARRAWRHLVNAGEASTRGLGALAASGSLVVGIATLLLGLGLLIWLGRSGAPGRRASMVVFSVVVAAFVVERALWGQADVLVQPGRFLFPRSLVQSYASALAPTAAIRALQAEPDIDAQRVLTFGEQPGRLAYAGLHTVDGYQSVYPLTYHDFFGRLIAPQWQVDDLRQTYYESWGNRALTFGPNVDGDLVKLAGARWLYVRGGDVPTVDGAIERLRDGDVTVYEVPDAFPRAFLVSGLATSPDDSAALDALAAADLDALRTTAFATDGAAAAAGLPSDDDPASPGSATITRDEPDHVEVAIDASRPSTLILTDVMAPGWQADVDGEAATIATVDGAFRGVAVTPESRVVTFVYRPIAVWLGVGLSVGSAILAGIWVAAIRRRDRRSLAAVSPASSPAADR
ncbi:MAG: DUF6044 family protein [Candidatus Limnocylindrales bacterium]